jgi:hypothetical protein
MPQSALFTIERSVATGHSLGGLQPINLLLKTKDRKPNVVREVAKALDNSAFINRHNSYISWQCVTRPVAGITVEYMREFLDSCETQIFQFDPDNAAGASPNALRSVIMDPAGYTERRSPRGDDQSGDYFTFSWTMAEVTNAA